MAIGAVILVAVGLVVLRGTPGGTAVSSPGGGSPTVPGSIAVASSAATIASTPVAAQPTASPVCIETARLEAVRAVAPDTGFPIPVRWTDLGPSDDLFFTLSDVAPTIPIDPSGPVTLTIGLSFMTGGDRYAFTAGAVDLAYDATSGRVSGDVDTGYGKNSNRATKDAGPSRFDGTFTRAASPGTNGLLKGSIAHTARTFAFELEMTERTAQVAQGPGCSSARPTDASFTP